MQAIRKRVIYVCDFLFAGNLSRFASTLGLNYGHLHKALYDRAQVTTKMLAQIVSRTHVRAEWLLTGAGPMLVNAHNRVESALQLPFKVQSVFPVFDTHLLAGTPIVRKKQVRAKRAAITDSISAAHAIHTCRVIGKPVCFFLGADAAADPRTRALAYALFSRGHITSAAIGAGCLPYELAAECDLTFIARTAAVHGVGLGESLCRWGQHRKDSFFSNALNLETPVTVHAELGELALHVQPALRGAENGAAWGAAAYVDQLIFTEQLNRCRGPGAGVCVILGEPERWLRMIYATVAALKTVLSDDKLSTINVVQLGASASNTQEQVSSQGGRFYHIKGTYSAAANKLLRACADVYDGNIPHDIK